MVSVAFINPFSEEGKGIVREFGDLNRVLDENVELIETVIESKSQEILNDENIPRNYVDLALKRFGWYLKKKNDRNYNFKEYAFLFNQDITNFDVIAFYLLCQAIGIKFGPNSMESRVMIESQGKIMENRLTELSRSERKETMRLILSDLVSSGRIKWTFLEDLIGSRRINLKDLIIDRGELILDKEDFIERFRDGLGHRDPERVYHLLIGDRIKELILIKMIMQKTDDFLKNVHERSKIEIEPNLLLLKLANNISKLLSESTPIYYAGEFTGSGEVKASPLNTEAFPPCIKKALEGVKSGGRNEVIVLFLTPFVSYARLNPSVFRKNKTIKVSDVDQDLQITLNEILPLIYEAADRCTPPLFEDQPQEKVNINAKLGFGMYEAPELKHEGETTWYTPMSCEKIKMQIPDLCRPNETCKKIGNPLSYYNRKLRGVKTKK